MLSSPGRLVLRMSGQSEQNRWRVDWQGSRKAWRKDLVRQVLRACQSDDIREPELTRTRYPSSTSSSFAGTIPFSSMTTINPTRKIAMKTTALEKAQMNP